VNWKAPKQALAAHRAVSYISGGSGRASPLEFTVDGEVIEMQLPSIVWVTGAGLYTGTAVEYRKCFANMSIAISLFSLQ
jgi:hypothetical protein